MQCVATLAQIAVQLSGVYMLTSLSGTVQPYLSMDSWSDQSEDGLADLNISYP